LLIDSDGQIGGLAGTTGKVLMGGTKPIFSTCTYPLTTSQGDLLVSTTADAIVVLAKNTTATRYLSNTGTNNNPAWAQVVLTDGVSGVLPNANGGGIVWSNVTGSTPTVAINNGYIASCTTGIQTFNVPATFAVGDRFAVTGSVAGTGTDYFVVQMNTGQTLYKGSGSTSSGGTVTATSAHDCIEFQCVVANTTFSVIRSEGTLTLA
jgi:hypothetical protein